MNKEDRMKAFSLRCEGLTWARIAELMNYDETTIRDDLQAVMARHPKCPAVLYPALARYICRTYSGSIERFANDMRVSPHRLRRVLVYGDKPGEHLVCKITEATGMTREEAFANDLPL